MIPTSYAAMIAAREGTRGRAWLDALPATLTGLLRRWRLVPDGGSVRHGYVGFVLPVRRDDESLALKVSFPDDDSRPEGRALLAWDGDGAVRALAVEEATSAILMERLDGSRDLSGVPVGDALVVIGDLLHRLRRHRPPAGSQFVHTGDLARRWRRELADGHPTEQLPSMLRAAAVDLCGTLDEDGPGVLHGDLHYENVLAGSRESWLAIDPKGLVGDPCLEALPPLWNRTEELDTADGEAVRGRHELIASTAALDLRRSARWSVVRIAETLSDDGGPDDDPRTALALAEALLPLC